MKKTFLFLSFLTISLASCSKDNEPSISGPTTTTTTTTGAKLTYEANAKAIFTNNCVGCHPAFASYSGVKTNINNILDRIQRDGAGVMPRSGKMPQVNIDIIKQWQADGLLEK
ncbi:MULTISPECIES: cytochrome c family protein [Flavobacterium]|uniref:Cytochrome c domain-containing protein n=2 Tax=Flavobacterium TaxID=237 RepID=A0AA94EXK8_9FLAO|nr:MULTISPECIES: hypothetical protein [Flavobacterium]AMA49539.1 hypothetical protein AWN65_08735 [Flavobacterium covae]MCH4828821.1 hypothetical protein [Flavobacterium columnare]MCH4832075.1 hypothetical protein [Flavobacterium columnare]MCJ1808182.1 cytochrome c [Flavobacterium covae]OWP82483.1 hypothetical protein BWK63_00235 [Flavobacterium covae]